MKQLSIICCTVFFLSSCSYVKSVEEKDSLPTDVRSPFQLLLVAKHNGGKQHINPVVFTAPKIYCS